MTTGSSPEATGATPEGSAVETAKPVEGDARPATETGQSDAKTPASTSAADETGAKEPSLLDAVRKVVDGDKETAEHSPRLERKGERSEAKAETPAQESADEAAEAEKSVPFHKHPRWQRVITERDGLRKSVETLSRERDGFKGDAEQFRQVTGFMDKSRLVADEVAQGFEIMALIKNSPAQAWEKLQPIVRNLAQFLGHELPTDLKEKVEKGYVDEATARETARLRNQSAFESQRSQEAEQRRNAETTAQERQRSAVQLANDCQSAVTAWENDVRTKDPDYARKQKLVEDFSRSLIAQHGYPPTKDGAVKVVQEAYRLTNERLRSIMPQRREINPPPRSSNSSTSATATPTTLRDVIAQAAKGGRAA